MLGDGCNGSEDQTRCCSMECRCSVVSGRSCQCKATGFAQAPGSMPIWQVGSAAWICGSGSGACLGVHEAGATITGSRSRVESRGSRCRRWVLRGEVRRQMQGGTIHFRTLGERERERERSGARWSTALPSQARSTGVPLGSVGKERGGKLGTTCTCICTEIHT